MKEAAASGLFALSAAVGDQREWNAITRLGCVSTRYGPRQLRRSGQLGFQVRKEIVVEVRLAKLRASMTGADTGLRLMIGDALRCDFGAALDGVNRSGGTPPPRQCKRRARR